ncbi:heat shock protein HslJ [Photorhabdus laumondii subsp. laumondii]|uniref:Heat shock protein HslJ n=4 Tax=Enterobacterales TaxID=91347 RepID=Q7N516_PHOLL|nr:MULTISPECIES: heat shock protein HslJ [Photorhabdus]MCE1631160.1 heat shock protein HslJ [Enterobacter hormaechei]AWK41933.1 heat-inducible protein [Photorhabdus laumondii subsp. laumondii]AXG42797.1 heat-inducible protein [Photorhabdus laumondii subsp. laumondii]AXG47256.1 heat-inducible protein [Photorhabdus laumondii subsp. laumondii]KTL61269.1 heat-inducible protein [Photorhabdus laumondii subsp. laumondii]
MKKILPLATATLLLATFQASAVENVSVDDLQRHKFVLVSVNGEGVKNQDGRVPTIEFGEKMHVSGSMCNLFMGQGKLKNGVLTVKNLASTQMLCSDEKLNRWDYLIGQVLADGVKVKLKDQKLTLSHPDNTLVYKVK